MTTGTPAAPAQVDFFISYTQADRAWAEWIAWQLEQAGYSTVIQAWDFGAGVNFVSAIHDALRTCNRMIAVLSPEYLKSVWGRNEWSAILAGDPASLKRKLLPVRVRDCEPDGLLRTIVYIDFLRKDRNGKLVPLTAPEAREALLRGLAPPTRPSTAPPFPAGP